MKIRDLKWFFGRNSEFWPTNINTGMWAWIGHRITGLVLVVYVFMHLSFLSQAMLGADKFDSLMEFAAQPFMVFLDFLLICAVIFHAMNGFRIIFFDMGIGIRHQKMIFWISMAIAAVLVVAAFWAIWDLVFVPAEAV